MAHLRIEWLAEPPDLAGADQWLDSLHRVLRGYKLLQVDVIERRWLGIGCTRSEERRVGKECA